MNRLVIVVGLIVLSSLATMGWAQATEAKPIHLNAGADGTLFLWNYSALRICAPGGGCSAARIPDRQIVKVLPASGGHAFVCAERSEYSEQTGTSFQRNIYHLDALGKVLESWDVTDGLRDFVVHDRRTYVLTDERVVTLEKGGKQTLVAQAHVRDQRIFIDSLGKLVRCRSGDMSEAIRRGEDKRAACTSSAGWSFYGLWYQFHPIACGEWLIEPVMKNDAATKTVAIQVRSLAGGQVVASKKIAVGELRCMNKDKVYDLGAQRALSLPDLSVGKPMVCGQAPARDVAENLEPTSCLDPRGNVGTLRPRKGK